MAAAKGVLVILTGGGIALEPQLALTLRTNRRAVEAGETFKSDWFRRIVQSRSFCKEGRDGRRHAGARRMCGDDMRKRCFRERGDGAAAHCKRDSLKTGTRTGR